MGIQVLKTILKVKMINFVGSIWLWYWIWLQFPRKSKIFLTSLKILKVTISIDSSNKKTTRTLNFKPWPSTNCVILYCATCCSHMLYRNFAGVSIKDHFHNPAAKMAIQMFLYCSTTIKFIEKSPYLFVILIAIH